MEYTGDIHIVARASEYLIIAEQLQARRQEFLNYTNNPIDLAIIGMEGRSKVLRETVKSLKMDGEEIVPPEWQLQAAAQSQVAGPEQEGASPKPAGGGRPAKKKPEKPIGTGRPEDDPIGGAPPVVPLEQMAKM
jgi:hypothetical protein